MARELIKKYSQDSVVFREGDGGEEMYIIHKGRVRLVKQFQTKIETLTVLERGDFFGEMSVIEDMRRSATAIAMEDGTELIGINKEQFEMMLQNNIEIAIRMIRKYAHRLMESNTKIEQILRDKQELDSGIQNILSNVRKKPEEEEELDDRTFGWLESTNSDVRFALKRPEALVGRKDSVTRQTPDVDLTKLDKHRTVSRRHARITCLDDGVFISEEVGVVNGTYLNGKQIEKGKFVRLNASDRLKFGQVEFKLTL